MKELYSKKIIKITWSIINSVHQAQTPYALQAYNFAHWIYSMHEGPRIICTIDFIHYMISADLQLLNAKNLTHLGPRNL